MEFRVLGPLEVVDDDGEIIRLGGPKPRAVVSFLLANAGEVCSVDQLLEAGWGDELPANPKRALQIAISRLRATLGASRLPTRDPGYTIRLGADDLDAAVFERMVTEAHRSADNGNHSAALERCAQAMGLWRGRPYADFEYEDFARPEVVRLNEIRNTAAELRLAALMSLGRHTEALPEIEAELEHHPLRERLWEMLLLALYRSGRQAEALRTYQRATEVLGEVGIEPGSELRRLEDMVLMQAPALDLAERTTQPESPVEALADGELTVLAVDARPQSAGNASDANAALLEATHMIRGSGGSLIREDDQTCLAVFSRPAQALDAALQIRTSEGASLLAGAIHVTVLRAHKGTYVGLGLSRVTRIAMVAVAGTVLASEAVVTALDDAAADRMAVDIGRWTLPGMSAPELLYEIVPPGHVALSDQLRADRATNLPARIASFVGREEDIAALSAMVRAERLVTLTGPGGVGKTTLAIQVASDAISSFRDGAWIVELASLRDEALIVQAVADVLEVQPDMGTVDQALLERLRTARLLLVIDNCEHLIDAVADQVASWLAAAPGLHVVATSREPLAVDGELTYPVPAMTLPGSSEAEDLANLIESEAVRLLLERVRAVRPSFELSADNAADVATICTRLDGIPLGIELAASRFAALTATEVAAQLDDRFRLLVTTKRTLPARQRTLEAAIAGSVELLQPAEVRLLACISVFEGGFDLAATESVCGGGRSVLEALEALVAKSLVVAGENEFGSRYWMLESVHAFAARLDRSESTSANLDSTHAKYYADLVAYQGDRVRGSDGAEAARRIAADQDNIRKALDWYVEHEPNRGLDAAVGMAIFCDAQGLLDEGIRRAESAIDAYQGPQDALFSRLLNSTGVLRFRRGDFAEAIKLHLRAKEVAVANGDELLVGFALVNQANVALVDGDLDTAESAYTSALQAFQSIGHGAGQAVVLGNLGIVAITRGDIEGALTYHRANLEVAEQLGSPMWISTALANIGYALLQREDYGEAERSLREAIAIAEKAGFDSQIPIPTAGLAVLMIETGRLPEAHQTIVFGLEASIRARPRIVADCLDVLAHLAVEMEDYYKAARFVGAGAGQRAGRPRASIAPRDNAAREVRIEAIHAALGEDFEAEFNAGSKESLAALVELAQSLDVPIEPGAG